MHGAVRNMMRSLESLGMRARFTRLPRGNAALIMNDTTATNSLRYDSENDAAAATGADDRHTITTYLSDALALERHIAQPLQRQLDMDDSARFGAALAIISNIKAATEAHIAQLEAQLEAAGGHPASGLKTAVASVVGAGAAIVDSARKTKVSKNLRDDYTALSLGTVSYTMLAATALGLGDESTAALAQNHLKDYAQIIMTIARELPAVVLTELQIDGTDVKISAADLATRMTQSAWK